MAFLRLSRPGAGAEGRLQAEPCGHAMDACGLGNMGAVASSPEPVAKACGSGSVKASRLGGGGRARPALKAPDGVRPNIPDLVVANTMPILYTSWPGPSMASQVNLVWQPRHVKAARARRTPNYGDGDQSRPILTNLDMELDNWPGRTYYDGTMNANVTIQTGSFFSARLGRGGLVFALLVVAVL